MARIQPREPPPRPTPRRRPLRPRRRVWLAQHAIPGSVEAIARLRRAGHRVLFVTNNSYLPLGAVEAALGSVGVPAAGDVLSSAMAAAARCWPTGRAGARRAAGPASSRPWKRRGGDGGRRGTGATPSSSASTATSTTTRCAARRRPILGGARLIGTNDDATYPTPDGPIPGGGSLLAAVATASGVAPVVAGKPYAPMAALVRARGSGRLGRRGSRDGRRPSRDRRRVRRGARMSLRPGALRRHAARPRRRAAAGLRSRRTSPRWSTDLAARPSAAERATWWRRPRRRLWSRCP